MVEKIVKSTTISFIVIGLYFDIMLTDWGRNVVLNIAKSYDIFIYCSGVLLFFCVLIAFIKIIPLYNMIDKNFLEILFISIGLFVFNDLFETAKEVTLQSVDTSYYLINKFILIGLVLIFSCIVYRFREYNLNNIWCVLVMLFSIIVSGVRMWSPNIAQNSYQIVHNDAVYSQIYNLIMGEPYSESQFGIYGHYGILYKLIFLRKEWFSVKKFTIVQMVLIGICIACFSYVCFKTIRNKLLRIIILLCLALLWGGKMTYSTLTYQAFVRIFPIATSLAFVTGLKNQQGNNNILKTVTAIMICTIGIIWNLEFGVVATIGCAFFFAHEEILANKSLFKTILNSIVYLSACIFNSYFLTCLFNVVVMHGAMLRMKNYLIPYFNDRNYITDSLQISLQKGNIPWVWVLIICLILIVPSFTEILTKKKIFEDDYVIISTMAVMTLGAMTYYINRSAAGCLWIIYPMGVTLLGVFTDRIISIKVAEFKWNMIAYHFINGIQILSIVFICAFSTCVGMELFSSLTKQDAFAYKKDNQVEMLLNRLDQLPQNTNGLGVGVDLLYSYGNRDTGYHLTDAAYMTIDAARAFEEALLDGNDKVVCMKTIDSYAEKGIIDFEIMDKLSSVYKNFELIGEIDDYRYVYLNNREY